MRGAYPAATTALSLLIWLNCSLVKEPLFRSPTEAVNKLFPYVSRSP
jgi:hypothetical protein